MPHETPTELRAMAAWYRGWAALAIVEVEREQRLSLAECLERMAREREELLEATAIEGRDTPVL